MSFLSACARAPWPRTSVLVPSVPSVLQNTATASALAQLMQSLIYQGHTATSSTPGLEPTFSPTTIHTSFKIYPLPYTHCHLRSPRPYPGLEPTYSPNTTRSLRDVTPLSHLILRKTTPITAAIFSQTTS